MAFNRRIARKKPIRRLPRAAGIRHRGGDRRRIPADGFAYISTVGWICRRERCRRSEDELDGPPTAP